ncbi:MAG: acyl--CoA ligase [Acidobacteria bacterium]|nr:acyl--CoA ligase [Acidobacteriota bacterium]
MATTETQKEMFLWLEKHFGGKEGVVDYPSGRRWSYRAFNDYSRRICASYKKDGGIQKGDRISWLAHKSSADILALSFGARKMGALPVIMNSRAGVQGIAWMINNVEARSLAYSSELVDAVKKVYEVGIPCVREFIALGERAGLPGERTIDEIYAQYEGAEEPEVEIAGTDDCLIAYTSGTTANAKPVVHKENNLAWTLMQLVYYFGVYSEDVWVVTAPPAFMGWAYMSFPCLRAAGKVCCVEFDPFTYLKAISDERGTHALLQPTVIRMLYPEYKKNPEEFKLDSLRIVCAAGEPVTEDVVAMLKEMFPNAQRLGGLGATEAVCFHTGHNSLYLSQHWDTLGIPLPGVSAELRDAETGKVITDPDMVGELYVKGPGVADRIWNNPELTEKSFPGGWWKTGDLFRTSETGHYYIAGRADYMFKSGGIKVYPEEVEENLKKHPDILDAVVFAIPHEVFGFVPMACIRNKKPLTPEGMEEWWLSQQFARYNRPRKWEFWGEKEFPKTASQKVDRRRLRDRAQQEQPFVDSSSMQSL